MEEKKHKKSLHIKIALITALGILLPTVLSIFFIQNSLFAIASAVATGLIVILILFIVLKPLQTLLLGTEILSRGNFNYRIDIRTNDEFEEVGDSFNLMATKLQQSLTNLGQDKDIISAERNKLSMVLSSVVDGIVAVDLSKNVVLINKAASEMTGYQLSEMQGKSLDQLIHLFNGPEEIPAKTYCPIEFTDSNLPHLFQSLTLIGKDGKQAKVNLITQAVVEGIQTNLGCILVLHDLTYESGLEQMRLDFVSMASHELKTPLTSIIGYLSVFLNENKEKLQKDQLDLLDRSLISARQLLTLVENILSVNKIEKEQFPVSVEPTDLNSVLTKAVEDLQNQAKLKNITLTLTPSQTPLPKVLADPMRIGEVINNLVSNALSYTNAGGMVSVYTQITPTEAITTVEDTGIGIPKEAIPHLFNKFFRVSNQLQKGSKGTGLGLYIAKSIITKLNGKIWVEPGENRGSKFHFSLPIAKEANLATIDRDKFVSQSIQSGSLNY